MPRRFVHLSHLLGAHDRRFLEAICSRYDDVHLITFRRGELPAWLGSLSNVTVHNLERKGLPYDDPDEERYPSRWSRLRIGTSLKIYESRVRKLISSLRPSLVQGMWVPTDGFLAARAGVHPLVIATYVTDVVRKPHVSRRLLRNVGWALGQADALVMDCQWVKQEAIRLYPELANKHFIIFPRGVELDLFRPSARPRGSSDTPTIVCHRSFEKVYDHASLFDALDRLPSDLSYRLLLLGEGSLLEEAKARVDRAAWRERVMFLPPSSREKVAEILREADLYVSCARQDGVSVSLLEALASGLPSVVTDLPPNREWVFRGENGELFPVGDATALARILGDLLTDGERRRRYSAAARAKAERDADWSVHRRTLLAAYDEIASRSSS